MTKEDIIILPNNHLRNKSKTITEINQKIKTIVNDMIAAILSWDESRDHEIGVALAAVQIDRLYKIVIVRTNHEDKNDLSFKTYINPKILKKEGNIIEDYEGCLSVPDIYGKVPRYNKIRLSALNLEGEPFKETLSGFMARILQHEIDHTEGILFIDHIKDREEAFYRLSSEGKLEKLEYLKDVKKNPILW